MRRNQRGEGKLGFIIALAVLIGGIYAGAQVIPVRITGYDFKDHIREEVRRAAAHGKMGKIRESILEKADELRIPIDKKKGLEIKKTKSELIVTAEYRVEVDLKVYTYVYNFKADERAPLF